MIITSAQVCREFGLVIEESLSKDQFLTVLFDILAAVDQDGALAPDVPEVCYIVTDDGRTVRWCSIL